MKNLYLHIGHGKTGSSYIQSCLALSTDILEEAGIFYPKYGDLERAKSGNISSGNYKGLESLILSENSDLSVEKVFNKEKSYLFSGERFFRLFSRTKHLKQLIHISDRVGFDKIKILLFIRNPIEHASSGYQQMIKREGKQLTIDDYFKVYNIPFMVEKLLMVLQEEEKIEFEVLNYSLVKHKLIENIASWLELLPSLIVKPSNSIVNRSMTFAELELQRNLNIVLGRSGAILSDKLCNELPEIPADLILPSVETQNKLLNKIEKPIQNVNSMIAESQGYQKNICRESDLSMKRLSFNHEQLSVIAHSLGNEIKSLRESNQGLLVKSQFFKGRFHIANNQFDKAINAFQIVLKLMPDHQEARANLNRCLHQIKTQKSQNDAISDKIVPKV